MSRCQGSVRRGDLPRDGRRQPRVGLRCPSQTSRSAAQARRCSGGLAQTPFSGVCDLPKGLTSPFQPISGKSIVIGSMPFYRRIYSPGESQFIAASTYRRAPIFRSECFSRCFVQRVKEVPPAVPIPADRVGAGARPFQFAAQAATRCNHAPDPQGAE